MTREILFRGIRTDGGGWVEGDLVQDCNFVFYGEYGDKEHHRHKTAIIDGGEIDKVIPETVGQYTGLTDKNFKKVFIGDKIRSYGFYEEDILEVIQMESGLYAGQYNGEFDIDEFIEWDEVEVIGTIHDHLLEDNP